MRPGIEEKMNDELNDVRLYNGMFETAIASAETSLSITAERVVVNQYSITHNNVVVRIICTNNSIATLAITIEYVESEGYTSTISKLSFDKDGTYDESYHNVPPIVRTLVHDVISTMIDDVIEYINNFHPSSS